MPTTPISAHTSWRDLSKLYLFFFYFSGVYQGLILAAGLMHGAASIVGLRQATYMSLLWLAPILLCPRITKTYSAIIGIILWGVSLVFMGYFAIYHQEFSESVIFVMLDTNTAEGSEFVKQYYRWWMLPGALIYSLPPLWMWLKLRVPTIGNRVRFSLAGVFLLITLIWPVVGTVIVTKDHPWEKGVRHLMARMEPATPWQLVMGYLKYQQQLGDMQALLNKNSALPPIGHLKDTSAVKNPTLVLVIGESTNRQRMSLYGYGRDTSPKLSSIKDELVVFNNVFASRPYTIETLEQALSFADQKKPDLFLTKPNLLNIMKQAGYKIYWITNQQTLTHRNTILTTFSKQADEQTYLNNNRMQNAISYDDAVNLPFEKALADKSEKKLIIIHLLGTHMGYDFRYPKTFDIFTDKTGAPDWLNASQLKIYNEYDNAVLYNDHIVYTLIDTFKKTDPAGFLLYFSDHGEEVFDYQERIFNGRNENNPSSAMYTIPFILWASPKWEAAHNTDTYAAYTNRPYSTSHFMHTWFDLSNITFDGLDTQKSLISAAYRKPPLLIGNPHDKKRPLQDIYKLNWVTAQ